LLLLLVGALPTWTTLFLVSVWRPLVSTALHENVETRASWSAARHSQHLSPAAARSRRIWLANVWPN